MAKKKATGGPEPESQKNDYEVLIGFVRDFSYTRADGGDLMSGHPEIGRVYRLIKDSLGYRLHIGRENNEAQLDGLFLGQDLKGAQKDFTFEIEVISPQTYLSLPITEDDTKKIVEWIESDNKDLKEKLDLDGGGSVPVIRSVRDLLKLMVERDSAEQTSLERKIIDYSDPETEAIDLSARMNNALTKISDKDYDFIHVLVDVVEYIAGTYSDKYEDGEKPNFSKWIATASPDLGKGANVFNIMKYTQRYSTNGYAKSDKVADIHKVIHYAMFELQRRKANGNI